MRRRTLLTALAVTAGGLAGAAPASAQESPRGCKAATLHLDIRGDKNLVRNGDTINYTLPSNNVGIDSCDAENITIMLHPPGVDGTAGAPQPKLVGQSYPAQATFPVLGPFPYTVAVNPGVRVVRALTSISNGVSLDIARSPINISQGASAVVFTPSITIDKVGDKTGPLPAPQDVKYTFFVRNGADPTLPTDATALANVKVTDDKCGNPTYSTGDANGDNLLQVGEVWQFTCTMTHPAPGTYHNVATANGDNILYGRTVPVVSPPDDWTVVLVAPVAAPPAPPQGAVKPVVNNQAPCVLSRSSSTTVRARQLNTIRVRVRNVDAGTTTTLTLPGGKKYTAKTDKNGIATFRVRPTKSGTATVMAAECSDVERLSVKPARKVVAQRAPRVTG